MPFQFIYFLLDAVLPYRPRALDELGSSELQFNE